MFDRHHVYWIGSIFQVSVMIALLMNMWWKRNCSGISLRSQILYALVFSTRHLDLKPYSYLPAENVIFKVVYILVTYATVLSMLRCLSKSYEKKHDTSRIDIWIAGCLMLSLIVNEFFKEREDPLQVLMSFSTYLEVVAMVPQFQFIIKNQRLDKSVILYLSGMALYSLSQVVHVFAFYSISYYGPPSRFQGAAAVAQLLLYCDFFRKMYPLLGSDDDDSHQGMEIVWGFFRKINAFLRSDKSKDIEASLEKDTINTGFLANNVSNVVLTPSTIIEVHKDKESSGY